MTIDPSEDSCLTWLQNSLQDLKATSAEKNKIDDDSEPLRKQLLAALDARNLDEAVRICQVYDSNASRKRASVSDLILPVVYSIEREWLSDERDYNATLSSFWCLQKLLEYSELEFPNKPLAKTDLTQGKVVLATAPGCQHNLGILVVSDYFRSWGWQSVTLLDTTRELLLQEVRDTSIDFLGLSVGHDAGLKGIPELLQELRLISINPALKIFVGGNIFDLSVEEYDWIGCDCLVTSPQDALQFCSSYTQYKRQ